MAGDLVNLRDQLVKALSWDASTCEGVCQAIAGAGTRGEVEDIVQVWPFLKSVNYYTPTPL